MFLFSEIKRLLKTRGEQNTAREEKILPMASCN